MIKSQTDAVKQHLLEGKTISNKDAAELYGIERLSAIIFNLRNKGWEIDTIMCEGRTRFGTHCSYGKYILKKEGK